MAKEVILKKLSQLLGAPEEELRYLTKLEKEELDILFVQTAGAVNGGQTDLWERLAKGSNLMPAFIAAKLSENVFGEVVCANVASYMKVKDALRIINHLSIDFMAKTSPHLIPERTKELVNAIPLLTTRKVTRILLREGDYYTLARFVDILDLPKVVEIAEKEVEDELVLLQISEFVENKSVVARIFMSFSEERQLNVLRAGYNHNFRDELYRALVHLSPDDMRRLQRVISRLPEEIRKDVSEDLGGSE